MKTISPLALAASLGLALAAPAQAQSIIDQWDGVKAPPPPKVEAVTVDPSSTALLVLDFTKQICGRNPRCVASLPKVAALLNEARQSNTLVVYSITPSPATPADILPQVKPEGSEPVVASHADKFLDTQLADILKSKNIKTVIVTGTAANGAVLYTASHAALMGWNVIVPLDGMSASPYAEQYVAWNMVNAPGVALKTKLTTSDQVKF